MENIQKKNNKKAGILITLCGGICWGISGCFGQYLFVEKSVTAEWLVMVRMILAGLLLVIIGLMTQKGRIFDIYRNKKDRNRLFIFAIFGMLFCQYTYFAAIQYSNAGTATVLQAMNPLMILMVVCVKEMRMPKGLEAGAICAALLGTFLISTHGNISSMSLTVPALVLGIGSAIGAASYNLLSGSIMRKYGVYSVVGFGMLLAGVAMLTVVHPWKYEIIWDSGTWWALVGVVVIGTAVAFSLFLKGVSMVGPFMGSLLGSVEPLAAIVASLLFLGAQFHPLDLAGFLLIIATVVTLSVTGGKGRKEETAHDESATL